MSKAMRQPNETDSLEYIKEYIDDQCKKITVGMAVLKKRNEKTKRALKLYEDKLNAEE